MAPPSRLTRLTRLCSRGTDSRRPKGPNQADNAQTGFYTHRGLDEQASSIRPGALTPDPPPRSRPREHGWTPGVSRAIRQSFLEDVFSRLTLRPDQGFGAYLRFFREGSA